MRLRWFLAGFLPAAWLLIAATGLPAQSSHGGHGGGAAQHARMVRSEKDFVEQMVFHHQEAIDTAMLIAESGTDPAIRQLAETIVRTQNEEVLALRRYFARWYDGLPSPRSYRPMMRDLKRVSGPQRTVQFLEDMITHHEAAVAMAEKVLTLAGIQPETRALAAAVINAQNEEIAFMKGWLAANR